MRRTFPIEAGANREAAQRFRGRETEKLGGAVWNAKALGDVAVGGDDATWLSPQFSKRKN